MIKRVCPKCGAKWYSSNTSGKIWICQECGSEIPKSQESEAELVRD